MKQLAMFSALGAALTSVFWWCVLNYIQSVLSEDNLGKLPLPAFTRLMFNEQIMLIALAVVASIIGMYFRLRTNANKKIATMFSLMMVALMLVLHVACGLACALPWIRRVP